MKAWFMRRSIYNRIALGIFASVLVLVVVGLVFFPASDSDKAATACRNEVRTQTGQEHPSENPKVIANGDSFIVVGAGYRCEVVKSGGDFNVTSLTAR